jgi:hypothetical protein
LADAEDFVKNNKEGSISILSKGMQIPSQQMLDLWPKITLRLELDQQLVLTLEDEARWAMANGLTTRKKMPNYLNFIDSAPLRSVRPAAVTLKR